MCADDGSGNGTFSSFVSGIPRGDTLLCQAMCTDASGNDSQGSNLVTTEVCLAEDVYEDSIGSGDTVSNQSITGA